MDKKLDFRVQRTYKTLMDALMAELKEKSFDDITVGELCECAMIRRATFYKHFGDKYELFAFSIRELQARFKQKNNLEHDAEQPKIFYVHMVDYFLQFVEHHNDMFKSLMRSKSSQILFDIMSSEIELDVLIHLREDEKRGETLPTKPELLAAMITGALVYTIKWWGIQEKKIPREELVQVCESLINNLQLTER